MQIERRKKKDKDTTPFTRGGPVTVISMDTGEVLRTEPGYAHGGAVKKDGTILPNGRKK